MSNAQKRSRTAWSDVCLAETSRFRAIPGLISYHGRYLFSFQFYFLKIPFSSTDELFLVASFFFKGRFPVLNVLTTNDLRALDFRSAFGFC